MYVIIFKTTNPVLNVCFKFSVWFLNETFWNFNKAGCTILPVPPEFVSRSVTVGRR